jgi:hypothetical protein
MSTTVYKLTGDANCSMYNVKWGPKVTHRVTFKGYLCNKGCLHAYRSPFIAALMRYAHCPRYTSLWTAKTPRILLDDGTKLGCAQLTTIERTTLPRLRDSVVKRITNECARRAKAMSESRVYRDGFCTTGVVNYVCTNSYLQTIEDNLAYLQTAPKRFHLVASAETICLCARIDPACLIDTLKEEFPQYA